ncbi:hypothetical protein [Kribbella sp. DT2]
MRYRTLGATGIEVYPAVGAWQPTSLTEPTRRRRPLADRAAS